MKVILRSHLVGELGAIKDVEGDVLAEVGSGNRKRKPGKLLSHQIKPHPLAKTAGLLQ